MALNNPGGATATSSSAQTFSNCSLPVKTTLVVNTAKLILPINLNRLYAAIFNYSSSQVTLVLREEAGIVVGQGIILLPYGSYEINQNNLYRGRISAIAATGAELVYFECTA